jgi:hypothetical protein
MYDFLILLPSNLQGEDSMCFFLKPTCRRAGTNNNENLFSGESSNLEAMKIIQDFSWKRSAPH